MLKRVYSALIMSFKVTFLAYQPQPQYTKPSKSLLNEDADLLKLVQDMHQ